MKLTTEHIGAMMSERGLRPSAQRVAVMRYMIEHRTHPSVDDIYTHLRPEMPSLSRTTVYNVLSALVGTGLVRSIDVGGDMARFDYSCGEHAHFVCSSCGAIHDIDCPVPAPELPDGFTAITTDVTIHGLCDRCAALQRN